MRILLQAPALLAETLALELTRAHPEWTVVLQAQALDGAPSLLIWSIDTVSSLSAIEREVQAQSERWPLTPILLLLPDGLASSEEALLNLPAAGLLQNSNLGELTDSVSTLLGGGRVVRLTPGPSSTRQAQNGSVMGLGQWLLVSGLQQISCDLQTIEALLAPPPSNAMLRFVLEGRRRELRSAHALLLWIWGPLQLGLADSVPLRPTPDQFSPGEARGPGGRVTAITLKQRNGLAVWDAIEERLTSSVQSGLSNATGKLLALDGLHPARRRDLLLALLHQLSQVLIRLRDVQADPAHAQAWSQVQSEVRRQALASMAGTYVQIPREGVLRPVAEALLDHADLSSMDADLPDPDAMLSPLLAGQPVLVKGQLLPPDDPRALLQLEVLVSNWLVRTAADRIRVLDLAVNGRIARYLLNEPLISTRELERLRNQLNTQLRWDDWVQRPIELYESKRTLFQLKAGEIVPIQRLEPRDQELSDLGWWQRQVALLLETRDALAPQVQALVRRLGDLMVVILTQVIGRGLGLIGRGIAQGMGRHLGRG